MKYIVSGSRNKNHSNIKLLSNSTQVDSELVICNNRVVAIEMCRLSVHNHLYHSFVQSTTEV